MSKINLNEELTFIKRKPVKVPKKPFKQRIHENLSEYNPEGVNGYDVLGIFGIFGIFAIVITGLITLINYISV